MLYFHQLADHRKSPEILKIDNAIHIVDNNVPCVVNVKQKVDKLNLVRLSKLRRVRIRGEEIRKFVLDWVDKHPGDISRVTARHFNITRQAVNKHLQRLVSEGALAQQGQTRNRSYKLAPVLEWQQVYNIVPNLAEDVIWRNDVLPILGNQPENVLDIWLYAFTEMLNNAVDHSGGSQLFIHIVRTAINTEMVLMDNGIGIFKKIQTALNLLDERHAILELSKGKLTTDPAHHTGEGIFFTSRMVDSFDILSGGVYFSHEFGKAEDWIIERPKVEQGTAVWMRVNNHTARTIKQIFDHFASGEDYGFTKTIVPVRLAQYGNDKLISRSQAKRLLARVELFRTVILDFAEVTSIGQAFADEVFRVFAQAHPEISLVPIKANEEVTRMIERVKSERAEQETDEEEPPVSHNPGNTL